MSSWRLDWLQSLVTHEVAVYRLGTPDNSEVMLRYNFTRKVTWEAGLSESRASATTASTGNVVCTLKKNGDSIGTVRFNASATGSFTFASEVAWAAGDVLTVEAPASADATLAGISMTLAGSRTA